MDAATSIANAETLQCALRIIQSLQIVGSLWPLGDTVEDNCEYDYIVVGAGTAGAVVAKRLAENKSLRVLLIEAGGDPRLESALPGLVAYAASPEVTYNFTVENDGYAQQCHRGNKFTLSLGKMLGGTSSLGYLSYERGNKKDFENWSAAANDPSWKYSNVLKYYKKSESLQDDIISNSSYKKYHGYNGPIIVTRESRPEVGNYLNALKSLGNNIYLDLNGNTTVGLTRPLYTIGNDLRQSTGNTYLGIKMPNLDILKNTEVQRILFDRNKNAIGVTALGENQKLLTLKAKREIILCAGAVNSPKILMLSGIGPKKHLESKNISVLSDLPVGENYQDRPTVSIVYKLGKANKHVRPIDIHMFPYPVTLGYIALNNSNTYPDYVASSYIMSTDKSASQILQFCAFVARFDSDICEYIYKEVKGRKVFYTYLKVTQLQSRGRILLRSNDPKDKPIIYGGTFSHDADLDKYAWFTKHFITSLAKSKYFKKNNASFVDPMKSKCGMFDIESHEYCRCYVKCMMHSSGRICGTCALGSVVDAKLRVKGVNRLRVVDASIMPTMTVSGPSATITMIGEKAADMILSDLESNI